jgi:hypothetical protein
LFAWRGAAGHAGRNISKRRSGRLNIVVNKVVQLMTTRPLPEQEKVAS